MTQLIYGRLQELRLVDEAATRWEEIKESTSARVIEEYIKEYENDPNTWEWVSQAKARLEVVRSL